MNEYDLIVAMSGADRLGHGKCIVALQPQRCDSEGNIFDSDEEYITEKPIVKLFRQLGGYVLVDLVFESVNDVDLRRVYGYLQDFFQAPNSVGESSDFPLLNFSIVPKALEGGYFALGVNPIFYALTPDDIKGEPRIIRMVFLAQDDPQSVPNFTFMKSDENELEEILNDADEE